MQVSHHLRRTIVLVLLPMLLLSVAVLNSPRIAHAATSRIPLYSACRNCVLNSPRIAHAATLQVHSPLTSHRSSPSSIQVGTFPNAVARLLGTD
jgi:hypothetical protein